RRRRLRRLPAGRWNGCRGTLGDLFLLRYPGATPFAGDVQRAAADRGSPEAATAVRLSWLLCRRVGVDVVQGQFCSEPAAGRGRQLARFPYHLWEGVSPYLLRLAALTCWHPVLDTSPPLPGRSPTPALVPVVAPGGRLRCAAGGGRAETARACTPPT